MRPPAAARPGRSRRIRRPAHAPGQVQAEPQHRERQERRPDRRSEGAVAGARLPQRPDLRSKRPEQRPHADKGETATPDASPMAVYIGELAVLRGIIDANVSISVAWTAACANVAVTCEFSAVVARSAGAASVATKPAAAAASPKRNSGSRERRSPERARGRHQRERGHADKCRDGPEHATSLAAWSSRTRTSCASRIAPNAIAAALGDARGVMDEACIAASGQRPNNRPPASARSRSVRHRGARSTKVSVAGGALCAAPQVALAARGRPSDEVFIELAVRGLRRSRKHPASRGARLVRTTRSYAADDGTPSRRRRRAAPRRELRADQRRLACWAIWLTRHVAAAGPASPFTLTGLQSPWSTCRRSAPCCTAVRRRCCAVPARDVLPVPATFEVRGDEWSAAVTVDGRGGQPKLPDARCPGARARTCKA